MLAKYHNEDMSEIKDFKRKQKLRHKICLNGVNPLIFLAF